MTEPSKEAVRAALGSRGDPAAHPREIVEQRWEAIEDDLQAALPIERQRWEQEIREKALSDKVVNSVCDLSSFPSHFDRPACRRDVRAKLERMFNIIFGEAEPVEEPHE